MEHEFRRAMVGLNVAFCMFTFVNSLPPTDFLKLNSSDIAAMRAIGGYYHNKEALHKQAIQSVLAIKDNPALARHTYITIDDRTAHDVCAVCSGYNAHRCTLDNVNVRWLCWSCFYGCRSIQSQQISNDVTSRRFKLLTPQFNINHGRGLTCMICCDRKGVYKNDKLQFICKRCKKIGTRMFCAEVSLTLIRYMHNHAVFNRDVHNAILHLIWIVILH